MSKNKKIIIIMLVVLAVYALIMFLVVGGTKKFNKTNNQITIIMGDNATFTYNGSFWTYVEFETTYDKLNWLKYDVYENNELLGNYSMWHNDKWYIFDGDEEHRKPVTVTEDFIALRADTSIKLTPFESKKIVDYSYVNAVLDSYGIEASYLTVDEVVSIDIDNDSKDENIYFISNSLPLDNPENFNFTIVFMEKQGEIYRIFTDIQEMENSDGCKPFMRAVLDYDLDGEQEIIFACGGLSARQQKDYIYKFKHVNSVDEFKLVVSNQ
jgi:hypothetical protein